MLLAKIIRMSVYAVESSCKDRTKSKSDEKFSVMSKMYVWEGCGKPVEKSPSLAS